MNGQNLWPLLVLVCVALVHGNEQKATELTDHSTDRDHSEVLQSDDEDETQQRGKRSVNVPSGSVQCLDRHPEAEYVGCFKERPSSPGYVGYNESYRLPNLFAFADGAVTTQRCIDYCRFKKSTYAALQNGNSCYCGNEYYRQEAYDCTAPCSGAPSEKCGNAWTNSVYSVCKKGQYGDDCAQTCSDDCQGKGCSYSTGQCIEQDYYQSRYVGCYKERPGSNGYNEASRLPNYFAFADGAMTVTRCIEFCQFKKYTYAALQNGNSCYCGDEYFHEDAFDCYAPCTGNHTEFCGNAWTNSVYSVCAKGTYGSYCDKTCSDSCEGGRCTLSTGQCIQDKYDPSQFVGCFKERPTTDGTYNNYNDQFRLPHYMSLLDNAMTVQRCIDTCRDKAYTYAALQNGNSCFCGDEYYYQPAFDCTAPCYGNSKETCGNAWTNSVYSVCKKGRYGAGCRQTCSEDCQGKGCNFSTGQCIVPDYYASHYVGCYKERPGSNGYNEASRLPNYFAFADNSMTIQRCIEFCQFKKHTYAALQNGNSCYCGDEYYHQQAFDCTLSCTGNPRDKCGNAWTNSVYSVCEKGKHGTDCQYSCDDSCRGGRCVLSTGQCIADTYDQSQYIGCYKERPSTNGYVGYNESYRLPHYLLLNDGMTVQRCIDTCRDNKYTYAALQDGRSCYCGDIYYYQQAFDCTAKCAGNPNDICGNAWTNSVHSVCKRGRYGSACTEDCNETCKNNVCLISNGFCPSA